MTELAHQFQTLIDQTLDLAETKSGSRLLVTDYDEAWRSAAEVKAVNNQSFWQPVAQSPSVDFSGLSNAIEMPIHSDIIRFYSLYWSGSLQATSDEGPLSLIQLWNQEDFERLVENLIGHYLNQKRNKQSFTVFFATTDLDSEYFLSIDNESGVIYLEEPGRAPIKQVEANLAAFLQRLTPVLDAPEIY